jgi:two-component system response regulator FixJ
VTALKNRKIVLIVDDDPSILKAWSRLIRSAGMEARTFDRPSLVLTSKIPTANVCLVVDIDLPEMNGIELCEALARAGCTLPIILVTGRNPIETQRISAGVPAIAVLHKPVDEEPFLEAINRAIARSIVKRN